MDGIASIYYLAWSISALSEASAPFKRFKIDLQYTQILNELPDTILAAATSFIEDYLSREQEPVHGNINSRNILIHSSPGIGDGIRVTARCLMETALSKETMGRTW